MSEVAFNALKKISNVLVGIDKADMSDGEIQICGILIKAGIGQWAVNEYNEVIFLSQSPQPLVVTEEMDEN